MKTYKGRIDNLESNQVFVFGSNLSGFHGAGAAGFASFGVTGNAWRTFNYSDKPKGWKGKWNVKGVGEGLQEGTEGKSYALPTVTRAGVRRSLTEEQIIANIDRLYDFALKNSHLEFFIAYRCDGSRLLNGYSIEDMARMFARKNIPDNIVFEDGFASLVTKNTKKDV